MCRAAVLDSADDMAVQPDTPDLGSRADALSMGTGNAASGRMWPFSTAGRQDSASYQLLPPVLVQRQDSASFQQVAPAFFLSFPLWGHRVIGASECGGPSGSTVHVSIDRQIGCTAHYRNS